MFDKIQGVPQIKVNQFLQKFQMEQYESGLLHKAQIFLKEL